MLRILPEFWVCLVVTAAVSPPLYVVISWDELTRGILLDASSYVASNFLLLMQQYDISGALGARNREPRSWRGTGFRGPDSDCLGGLLFPLAAVAVVANL